MLALDSCLDYFITIIKALQLEYITLFQAKNLNKGFLLNYITQFNNFRKSVKDYVSHRLYRE